MLTQPAPPLILGVRFFVENIFCRNMNDKNNITPCPEVFFCECDGQNSVNEADGATCRLAKLLTQPAPPLILGVRFFVENIFCRNMNDKNNITPCPEVFFCECDGGEIPLVGKIEESADLPALCLYWRCGCTILYFNVIDSNNKWIATFTMRDIHQNKDEKFL
ncbi:hypothetical protein [Desulfonema magnum]|uniref:hypothetical protein n=1 Tax=Desulfonema magnum TaxID=45655 RepID=UPI001A9BCFF8|nr:hypothetical protein [Desulfonema magnum]